jgi:archaellum component FlaF (FlaF/FlaG flagellin family)
VVANGTATFFRFTKSDETTVLLDGSVGTSDADLILSEVLLFPLMTVTITAGTIIRNNI